MTTAAEEEVSNSDAPEGTPTTPQGPDELMPALFEHCVRTYKTMFAQAETRISDEGSMVVYEGFITKLVTTELNYSVPYFTSIRRALLRMGCIRQLKRGGSTTPSQWEMVTEPTREAFLKGRTIKSGIVQAASGANKPAMLDTRMTDLEKRMYKVEKALGLI